MNSLVGFLGFWGFFHFFQTISFQPVSSGLGGTQTFPDTFALTWEFTYMCLEYTDSFWNRKCNQNQP